MNAAREITRDEVLDALARHVGAANGIHVHELVREIRGEPVSDAHSERKVRSHVEILQRQGEPICALPQTGYFLAGTAAELDRSCEWLYARAMCSLTRIAGVRRVALPDLRGQLRLPMRSPA